MNQFTLHGDWTLCEPSTGLSIDAVVPGTVFTALLDAGKIDDPFYRANEEHAISTANRTYTYERTFDWQPNAWTTDPAERRQHTLVCEGLDTLATITINGQLVGQTDNMHRRYRFDVSDLLRCGENRIRISFAPSPDYIRERHHADPIWGQSDTMEGFTHLRKAHYMFGWDWGPKIPDAGIFRPIYIESWSQVRVEDVEVRQIHEEHTVEIDLSVNLQTAGSAPADGAVSEVFVLVVTLVDPLGNTQSQQLPVGNTKRVVTSFVIPEPKLWWPSGYGTQPLYEIRVEIRSQKAHVLDERRLRIGLRTLEVDRTPDEWGASFAFRVNGVPLFAKGANYIPEDNLLGRRTPEKTRQLLQDCVDANFNLVRVWGGGLYPDDWFYDIADELGLIVWQDFMYACGTYRLKPSFEANVRAEAEDVLRRIRHHASLGLLCGNNEMEEAWCNWDFPKPDDLRADYLRLFEEILPELCQRLAPDTFYWPASPSSGGHFESPTDENRGDVHYWDVWHGLKPFTEYRKFYFRFCSEFGFQSFPSMKTIESFTLPEDRNVFSYVMERHQKNQAANGKILYYLAQNFQYPKDLDALVYTSQVLQAEAIKYGVEHWRRNLGRCMGSIYWQLNDCWPVASWSSIDHHGRWKALHYFARRFYHPVLLSAAESETGVTLVVTNDRRTKVRGHVRWALRHEDGRVVASAVEPFVAEGVSAVTVTELDFADELRFGSARRNTYLEYELLPFGERSRVTSESEETCAQATSALLFAPAKHFDFHEPGITAKMEDHPDGFTVLLTAERLAKYVELSFAEADVRWTDNFFDLVPGVPRSVRLEQGALPSGWTSDEARSRLRIRSLYDTYR